MFVTGVYIKVSEAIFVNFFAISQGLFSIRWYSLSADGALFVSFQ